MRSLSLLPVTVPMLVLVGTGIAGLDFGRHWDERVHHARVRDLLATGVPKAVYYYYPGLCHRVLLWALAPEVTRGLVARKPAPELLGELQRLVASPRFQLRGRALFLGVTSLGVLWVYLAVLAAGGGVPEAFLGASLLATSWEVGYHARWIAPDGINMQLAALSLLLLVTAERRRDGWSLALAAAPAGLAFGCKYQVGLLLLPALLLTLRGDGARRILARGAAALGAFALAFLASTPEAVYDAGKLVADSAKQASVYASATGQGRGSPLWGYRVSPGPVHLARNVEYLALVQPSPFLPASLALSMLAVAGAVSLHRGSRRRAVVLLSFPAAYVLFQSTQRLHLVRNLLPLAPFGAFLAARGATALASRGRIPRGALGVALATIVVADAGWGVWAAGTIRSRGTDRFVRELAHRVASRPDVTFAVSPKVTAALAKLPGGAPPNAVQDPGATGGVAAFYHREALEANEWPAGRGLYRWLGPHEINFSYYPSWPGDERILVMPVARARALGSRVLR